MPDKWAKCPNNASLLGWKEKTQGGGGCGQISFVVFTGRQHFGVGNKMISGPQMGRNAT